MSLADPTIYGGEVMFSPAGCRIQYRAASLSSPLVNWDDGVLLTLGAGQTARCEGLVAGQLYAVLLYNSSQADIAAELTVVWSNLVPPLKVTVPGTTADAAPANFLFVSGNDTNFVSISLGPAESATVEAVVISVSMPTNTAGITSAELPNDGQFHAYSKYTRYYTESATGWRNVTIQSPVTQFVSLKIVESAATVLVVNYATTVSGRVNLLGPTANLAGTVNIEYVSYQKYETYLPGNGGLTVWMNGDSPINSAGAKIALQQLSAMSPMLALN